jgi:putative hydrolase of the HAD superfamily
MTGIAVVLFDLDDTLFAHSKAVARGVAAHLQSLGGAMAAADPDAEFVRWTKLEEQHYHRYLNGELGFHEQRRHRSRDFVEPYGVELGDDDSADEWFGRYLLEYERAWELHDDVLECLHTLAPPVRFGIITNAELPFQQSKLDATGLTPYLEHVVASGDVGFAKPDARIFHHAAALFEAAPSAIAYVGDRLHTDAIGATNAGMHGVWIDRAGTATQEELALARESGVPVIRSLSELPAVLRS